MAAKVLWSPKEDAFLRKYYGHLSYSDISRSMGRSWSAVRNRSSYIGLTDRSNLGRKYSANTEFFSTPNVINSYWAGFIAADGCISDNGRLAIGLARLDIAHLDQLCIDLDYTGGVRVYEDRASLSVNSKKITYDLKNNFNITPRKSATLGTPNIDEEALIKAFISGVIDGDGSISAKPRITVYGTRWILGWIKEYFDLWTTKTRYKRSEVRKIRGKNLYSYRVNCRRAKEVGLVLLSVSVPRLWRKWSRL